MWKEYSSTKTCLVIYRKDNPISGAVLVDTDTEDAQEILKEMADSICEDACTTRMYQVQLSTMMKAIREGGGGELRF